MEDLKRIVVVVENRIGVIADIAGLLAEGGINLEALSTRTTDDSGAVIITTREDDRALAILNRAGYKAVSDDAIVLRLPDVAGALARVTNDLNQAGVNIQGLHILSRQDGYATIALTVDDREKAAGAIKDATIL